MTTYTHLVTGGAGFIGNHLCRYLLSIGDTVICVDNLYSGHVDNITDLIGNSNFTFIKADIESADFLENLNQKYYECCCVENCSKFVELYCIECDKIFCENHKHPSSSPCFGKQQKVLHIDTIDHIDFIYHLACPASPTYYQATPLKTINTCVNGTINVLEYARMFDAKILFTSTSEIYGEPLEHPQTEKYRGNVNTLGIRACYDEGKRLAETLVMEYHRLYNVDTKIVRIFNTYGPRMYSKDGRVVTNFIDQALSGIPITIYGDGTQTRSFCYIDDMIQGLVTVMNSSIHGPVNLGNPEEHTIHHLASLIIELTRSTSIIKNVELPDDDPSRRCPDISKAFNELGWIPKIRLEHGLRKMIDYINSHKLTD